MKEYRINELSTVGTYQRNGGERMSFSQRLDEYIKDMGLTQRGVSAILGKSPSTVNDYLRRNPDMAPPVKELIKIADELCVSIDWLLGRTKLGKWSPQVTELRLYLQTKVSEVKASDTMDRIGKVVELIKGYSDTFNKDWLMAGVLGVSDANFNRIMNNQGEELNEYTLGKFSEFTGLPELWLLLGDEEALNQSVNIGEWKEVVLRLAELKLRPEQVMTQIPTIHKLVNR
jgi:transcriptional regulator with XRE-family HTH domain